MPEEKKQEEKAEKESKREESKKIENQEKGREEKLVKAEITEEMQKAYIDYAMSVIVSRALPAVEDGLKPVHRRILYTIYRLGLLHSKQTKKSATIVGNCMAKFHPHGDIAIYDALARMTQDFSLRYPLVYGQGNWGSIDGDAPAHMRYTEAKLSKISDELLQDIDKGTVEWQPNFDNSLKEPLTLPAKLPNLLLNGASGIAVGMTTNIPPHNLQDVCDAIIAYIENNQIKIEKLIKIIRGPDFPTGGYIIASQLEQLYKTGKASLTVRGKTVLEKAKKRERIVITEIPYMLNKSALIEEIANLVRAKKLPDIAELRDESAKGKMRIVIGLRKGADMRFTLNRLFQYTRLQDRFNAIMLALVGGNPQTLNLKEIIACYVDYRKKVVTKRCKFELQKAEERQTTTP